MGPKIAPGAGAGVNGTAGAGRANGLNGANGANANARANGANTNAQNAAANAGVNNGVGNAQLQGGENSAAAQASENAAQMNATLQARQAAMTGSISGITSSGFTLNNGTSAVKYSISPQTTFTLNGRPTTLSQIPANAQVRVVTSKSNSRQVQQLIATTAPQAGATGIVGSANGTAANAGTAVDPATGGVVGVNGTAGVNSNNGATVTPNTGTATLSPNGTVNGTTPNTGANNTTGIDPATGLPVVDPNAPGIGQIPGVTGPRRPGPPGAQRPLPPPAHLQSDNTATTGANAATAATATRPGERPFEGFGNDVAGTIDRSTGAATLTPNATGAAKSTAAPNAQSARQNSNAPAATTSRNLTPGELPANSNANRNFSGFGNDVAGTVNPTTGQVQTQTTSGSGRATAGASTTANGMRGAAGASSFRSTGPAQTVLKVPDVSFGSKLSASSNGLRVSDVSKSGLAASAHLRNGDVIQSINGQPVSSSAALSYELLRHAAGDSVNLGISRNGKTMTEKLTLPADHQALLQNSTANFDAANAAAMKSGATTANPQSVEPSRESINNLTEENVRLREELNGSSKTNP